MTNSCIVTLTSYQILVLLDTTINNGTVHPYLHHIWCMSLFVLSSAIYIAAVSDILFHTSLWIPYKQKTLPMHLLMAYYIKERQTDIGGKTQKTFGLDLHSLFCLPINETYAKCLVPLRRPLWTELTDKISFLIHYVPLLHDIPLVLNTWSQFLLCFFFSFFFNMSKQT